MDVNNPLKMVLIGIDPYPVQDVDQKKPGDCQILETNLANKLKHHLVATHPCCIVPPAPQILKNSS